MIKLYVLDLDGCISEPFKTPDWTSVSKIRELNRRSRDDERIPPLTICTGRPLPYAEAVAQWLDIRLPFIFESAGLYDWETNLVETGLNGRLESSMELINEAKSWIRDVILPDHPGVMPEFSKMMDAGIVSPDRDQIRAVSGKIVEKVHSDYPGLEVHRTDVSVNILIRGNNKLQGVNLLSGRLQIGQKEMAYIGDSEGDIPALQRVGFPLAPENAIGRVKEIATVLPFQTTRAVLEGYEMIIERNRG
ncbi:MAG: HAD hydrolase family protein [Balneolaceae bacterium]